MTAPTELVERRDRVAVMTRQGRSAPEIAAILGVTERTVIRDRVATGCARPVTWRTLTAEDLQLAQQLLDDGCSVVEVARTVGCSADTIHKHFPGRGWTLAQRCDYIAAIHRARKVGMSC